MYRSIIGRVVLVVPTLIGAAALVFLLMRLVPGDICLVRLGSGGSGFTAQALATCHAEIGLDRPWMMQVHDFLQQFVQLPAALWTFIKGVLQFLDYLWALARFDFGTSMWSGEPVIIDIATRFPISLEVAGVAPAICGRPPCTRGTLRA